MDNANRGVRKVVWNDVPSVCKECGDFLKFVGRGTYKCESCGFTAYDDFGKIRKYLDEFGPSPAVEISEGTGVSVQKINNYLRQGRMEITEGSSEYIRCESCGAPIKFGRYCPECAAILSKKMQGSIGLGEIGERPKSRGTMHTDLTQKGRRGVF